MRKDNDPVVPEVRFSVFSHALIIFVCRSNERGGDLPKAPDHLLITAWRDASQVDVQRRGVGFCSTDDG